MSSSNKVLIIGEAGVNHNGDISLARQMVAVGAKAGIDMVKFQTFKTESLVTKVAKQARYQALNTNKEESQFDMLKRLEINQEAHVLLLKECQKEGVGFLSSAFDFESIEMLSTFDLPTWKIPSGEITNVPYLRKIGSLGKKVIISTGMANLGEIDQALSALENAGTKHGDITVLHCTTEYPTPWTEVNLLAMVSIREAFKVAVGYSDHTPGIEVPIAAVALGATVIEKHFTVNKNLPGPDHRASLDPMELQAMVSGIRNIELALGDGIKRPTESELRNKAVARKSLVARKAIQAGELFTEDNLTAKRPGSGIPPSSLDLLLGRRASRPYSIDDLIEI